MFPNATWINFLRKYGPSATNDNMYDETIEQSRRKAGVEPLVLPTPFLDDALECLRATPAKSVVLTGTAGDGKTYYCRQLWEKLGGDPNDWANDSKTSQGMYSIKDGAREIFVIKDLSEVQRGMAKTVIARISKDLAEGNPNRLYVIAANHGQLFEQWSVLIDVPAVSQTWQCIEDQLVDGVTTSTIPVKVFNLSVRPAADSMRAVLKEVLEHPQWSRCDTCPLNAQQPCPIVENRGRLLDHKDAKTFRSRLLNLMELSTQNNQHIPVRQQLMLVTNILLGHPDPDIKDGLLTCNDVAQIQERKTVWKATPYGNAVGENLSPRKRRNREIFEKLDRLGLGHETNNRIDRLLTLGGDDPSLQADYKELIESDPIYGSTDHWRRAQAAYLENGAYETDEEEKMSFAKQLRLQRQRLFFTLPDEMESKYPAWHLTVYQNARTFLSVITDVLSGTASQTDIVRLLVRGLNRVFTGELLEVSDALVLATAGSFSQSRTNLLYEDQISVRPQRGESITLVSRVPHGIALRVQLSKSDSIPPVDLALTCLRFEFLCRVADGALPSSFSLECYEDILTYKSQVLAALDVRRKEEGDDEIEGITLRFLEVDENGRVRAHRVAVQYT